MRRGQRPGTAPHPTLPTQLEVHSDKPVVLYRDTNAWCPFCERVRHTICNTAQIAIRSLHMCDHQRVIYWISARSVLCLMQR